MIEKMKFVSITGPTDDIDQVINQYLSKYEIHLENAMTELNSSENLSPYVEANPYKELLAKGDELISYLDKKDIKYLKNLNVEMADRILSKTSKRLKKIQDKIVELETHKKEVQAKYDKISPFVDIKYDIEHILNLKHIKFRFGRISKPYYSKFQAYVDSNSTSIFIKSITDEEFVWGIYFVPQSDVDKIDATYTSMHFERTFIPDIQGGTPEKACNKLKDQLEDLTIKIEGLTKQITSSLMSDKDLIFTSYEKIKTAYENFDVRKMATHTNNEGNTFYFICGWMTAKDTANFTEEIKSDDNVVCIVEDETGSKQKMPPTKLKNPKFFKPFEMYIRMYGLPAYNEIDPTIFVALTYSFIFGAMFGDVGQGLCLMIGGFLLYKFKKSDLAGIISICGICSVFFGFMFGSIFGFEDVIHAVWLKPVNHMSSVPFIGRLNTVFVVTIGFGMALILVTMIFHIINGIQSKDVENTLFDTNALAGFIFYGSLTLVAVLMMTGKKVPAIGILLIMFLVPLLIIGLKEPLTHLVTGKKPKEKTGIGMFLTQTFFELFEVLLSYFSNTLSFIRIGAFAVSHASMMEVVLMLGKAESSSPNWVVIVLGNIFIMGLEGLIVGIQVLRLEYYEMFSRYYKGNGREYKPFKHVNINKKNKKDKVGGQNHVIS